MSTEKTIADLLMISRKLERNDGAPVSDYENSGWILRSLAMSKLVFLSEGTLVPQRQSVPPAAVV